MVVVEGSGVLPKTVEVEDGSAHVEETGGVVAEMETLGEVPQTEQVLEQQQVMSGGDGKEVVTGAEVGDVGIEILSLSFGDEKKNLPSSGVNDEAEATGSQEGHPEKRPQVEENGSGEERSKEAARSLISALRHGVDDLKKEAEARFSKAWKNLEEERKKLGDKRLKMNKQLVGQRKIGWKSLLLELKCPPFLMAVGRFFWSRVELGCPVAGPFQSS